MRQDLCKPDLRQYVKEVFDREQLFDRCSRQQHATLWELQVTLPNHDSYIRRPLPKDINNVVWIC